MDPDTCLAELRKLAAGFLAFDINIHGDSEDYEEKAQEFAEKFAALDLWLASKGFLPGAWNR